VEVFGDTVPTTIGDLPMFSASGSREPPYRTFCGT
jgi:hypothetical protein